MARSVGCRHLFRWGGSEKLQNRYFEVICYFLILYFVSYKNNFTNPYSLRSYTDTNKININIKTHKTFLKREKDAVTFLEPFYTNEFFIAGFSSGSISIYSSQTSMAVSTLATTVMIEYDLGIVGWYNFMKISEFL